MSGLRLFADLNCHEEAAAEFRLSSGFKVQGGRFKVSGTQTSNPERKKDTMPFDLREFPVLNLETFKCPILLLKSLNVEFETLGLNPQA